MKYRVMFFGTPAIAKEILDTLYNMNEVDLVGVVCQPDAEFNRKKEPVFCEVKKYCIQNNINLYQPIKIGDIKQEIINLNPHIIITCAYGQFIPQSIIDIPKYKIVNVHASLLPKLRGGAPIHYAILNGDFKTGITLMHTIKKMDAGDILFQQEISITNQTTTKQLTSQLAELGSLMIKNHFLDLVNDNLKTTVQNEDEVSFAYNIKKFENIIDFNNSAFSVLRFVNAMYDKPIALAYLDEKTPLKIHQVSITNIKSQKQPGYITLDKKHLYVATTDYDIAIEMIQLPNKNAISIKDFLNANKIIKDNDRFLDKDTIINQQNKDSNE